MSAASSSPTLVHNPDVRFLFSADDYPAEAVRKHWQGTVQLNLTVGTDGRVADCAVVRSSGYQLLDDTTCKILEKRAQFRPARNSAGDAVVDHVLTPPIEWRLFP